MKFVLLALLPIAAVAQTADIINTYAGGGPNNVPATSAVVPDPASVALDSSGNIYFVAGQVTAADNRVFEVNTAGTLTLIAGNDVFGYGGDGGPATKASLNSPQGVAVDSSGNVYIADTGNCTVRKVTKSSGVISTVAGTPQSCGFGGDGGAANTGKLNDPYGVAVDASGNMYIADTYNCVVRYVTASDGKIKTIAGNSSLGCGFSGDGGAATAAQLYQPYGVALDGSGNVYIADTANYRIRKVTASTGKIGTIAGNGIYGFSGDGGPATSAEIGSVNGLASDASGNVFIADTMNCVIREVNVSGSIDTVAGASPYCGYSGDGGPAVGAELYEPYGVAVNSSDAMFIADEGNGRIRKAALGGRINTVAGNGTYSYTAATSPTGADFSFPNAGVPDASGNVYIADFENCLVWKATASGAISVFAGTAPSASTNYQLSCGYSGDGGPATSAQLYRPSKAVPDSSGNVYIADTWNCVLRKVDTAGAISTVAGFVNDCGYWGDGEPATSAALSEPAGLAFDSSGNLYIADSGNYVVRKIAAGTAIITTVAGNHAYGFSGDGGPATNAQLSYPQDVAADASGNLYIADSGNSRIRVVSGGAIETFAGNGSGSYGGDGGPAAEAALNEPSGVAVDAAGDVLIADKYNNVIRFVDGAGTIHTIAGSGSYGFAGDGEVATTSCPSGSPPTCIPVDLASPSGISLDSSGNIYIADTNNNRIRSVTAIPSLGSSARELVFDDWAVGTASNPQQLTLSVAGPVTISDIVITGDFTQYNNCPSSLSSGQSCQVNVTFTPSVIGARTGTLTIATNSFFNNNVVVQLSGTGGGGVTAVAGALLQMSVGADGSIWGINGAGQIYTYDTAAQTWMQIPGQLMQIAAGSSTAIWGLNAMGQIYQWNGSTWSGAPGTLAHIAVGADGDVWGLNSAGQIYHYVPAMNTWAPIPGALIQLSVGSAGAVYGVNATGYIYWFNPGTGQLQQVTPTAGFSQVSVGIDGDLWAVQNGIAYHYDVLHGTMVATAGASIAKVSVGSGANVLGLDALGNIYQWNAASQQWLQIPGTLSSIAVGAGGTAWGINSSQQIFRLTTQSVRSYENLNTISGSLGQVSVGVDGSVWGVNSNTAEHFNSGAQSFEPIASQPISQLSVGSGADIWGLDPSGSIYRYDSVAGSWNNIPGELNLIQVGANGSVWGINAAGNIYTYNLSNSTWTNIPGQLALPSQLPGRGGPLAVGADGTVWGINAAQQTFRFDPSAQTWVQIPGALVQISVGDANNVWGINAAQQVYSYDGTKGSWVIIPGALLVQISVAFDGSVWGVNAAGDLYRWDASTQNFSLAGSDVTTVCVGNGVSVWAINATSGAVFSWF